MRVLAGQADRERPVPVDQADHVPVDLAGQHHAHDIHRLGGGHPQPGPEGRLQAELVQVRADLRAAAVHDDRAQARVPEEHDVLREGRAERVVGHRVAAVLDHDGLAVEPLQPRQRLDQRGGLGERAGHGLCQLAHVEYAEFSCT